MQVYCFCYEAFCRALNRTMQCATQRKLNSIVAAGYQMNKMNGRTIAKWCGKCSCLPFISSLFTGRTI